MKDKTSKELLEMLRKNYAEYHSDFRPIADDHKMDNIRKELDERNVSHSHLMIPNKPM